jgi:hypothetical protein
MGIDTTAQTCDNVTIRRIREQDPMNNTRAMALAAARNAAAWTGRKTCIWFLNRTDGWAWDFEDQLIFRPKGLIVVGRKAA